MLILMIYAYPKDRLVYFSCARKLSFMASDLALLAFMFKLLYDIHTYETWICGLLTYSMVQSPS
jgi:hypothetical protein